ncbi:hypothetical protein pdam_00007732 [Pocillopora damicornis]|uniref:Uncharacterized protein n=1 Tax=Pocillopora damicornis TaxID=46731 RepID=A0A3M6UZU6_POCDA|nr:hypothetical protein pdam_00007732 [Pocillopora damicornis]
MPITTQTRVNPRFAGRSHMLASVKEGLYHPMLPTFRRMDMDTAVHKLPEEHSRTTTPLTREDFESRTITLFRPAEKSLSGTRITETGRQLQSTSYQPIESGGMAEFLKRSMTIPSDRNLILTQGVSDQFLPPSIVAIEMLIQEPVLQQCTGGEDGQHA